MAEEKRRDEELKALYKRLEELLHPHTKRDQLVGGVSSMVEAIADSSDVKVMKNATIYSGVGRLGMKMIVIIITAISGILMGLTSWRTNNFINAMIASLGGGMELETQATIMVWTITLFWLAVIVQFSDHISEVIERTGKGVVYYTKDDFFIAEHQGKKSN